MKYFLFFFLIVTIGHSQTGKITYSAVFNFGGSSIHQTKNDLYFTNVASFYQSQIRMDEKSEREEEKKKTSENTRAVDINITVGTDSIGDVYYHNLKSRNIICRGAIYENRDLNYYIYEDNTNIKWKLLDEFKNISGYKCQKAATKFRGRNYEAWFTSEIPLSFGPWKFNGLPGLILEVYDQTGEVYFTAEYIQIPYAEAAKKVQKPSDDPIIDHQEFISKAKNIGVGISQAMIARMPEGSKLESIERKYNGLELEYEWDKE